MSTIAPPSLDALTPGRSAGLEAHVLRPGGAAGRGFASALSRAAAAPDQQRDEELQEAADQLVATAFILPLLEQVRNDPFKSDLFHGGKGEEVFGQQLDVIFAENITSSANFGLSQALVERFSQASSDDTPTQVNLRG